MNPPWWLQVLLGLIGLGGVWLTARLTSRAQHRTAEATEEIGAGQLALDIATRLDNEVTDLKTWRRSVRAAWDAHTEWDAAIVEELHRLDPGAARRLPKRPRLPLDD